MRSASAMSSSSLEAVRITTLALVRLTRMRSASLMPSPSPSMSISTISGFFLSAAWKASSVASPSATILSLVPARASWMPRRNRGWLSSRATRIRSAKEGLQLVDFELCRVGNGVGPGPDQELTADRLHPVLKGAQPRLIAGRAERSGGGGPLDLDLKQIAAAGNAHDLSIGVPAVLVERLAHEPIEAGFDRKRHLVRQLGYFAGHRGAGLTLVPAHGGADGLRQRQLRQLGGKQAFRQGPDLGQGLVEGALDGVDVLAPRLERGIDLGHQRAQRVELQQRHTHELHRAAKQLGADAAHIEFVHVGDAPVGAADPQAKLLLLPVGARDLTRALAGQHEQ